MLTILSFVGSSRNNLAHLLVGPFVIDRASQSIMFNKDQEWIKATHAWNRLIIYDPYIMPPGDIFQMSFSSPNTGYASILLQKQSGDIEFDVYTALTKARVTNQESVYLPIYHMGNADKSQTVITDLMISGIKKFELENADCSMTVYIGLLEGQIEAKAALKARNIEFRGFWDSKSMTIKS